jgi:hypothetical protein
MTRPNDDDRQRAKTRAVELQTSLDRLLQDERDNEALLEQLDQLAKDYRELAEAWDNVDPQMATKVRQREEEIHTLRGRVQTMTGLEGDEASKLKSAVLKALRETIG